MAYLGLVLGDKFETKKGLFVITGIQFNRGKRIGVIFKPYVSHDDPRTPGSYLADEVIENNYKNFEYKGNEK